MASGTMFGRRRPAFSVAKSNRRAVRSGRAVTLFFVAAGLLSVHLVRLVQLQLLQGQYHRQLAETNRIRPIHIMADRGKILDRHGQVLAGNQLVRSVYIYPREQSPDSWKVTAQKLGPILQLDPQDILQKLEKVGYKSSMPVRILQNLKEDAFTALAEAGQFAGIEIRPESNRSYPHKSLAAHVLGYIGEASEADLKKNPDFPIGMLVGQMGLERLEDDRLRGKWGSRLIEVDAQGRELKMLGTRSPESGEPLKTTLDLNLQQAAERALTGQRGAVVVLDVKTGGIMAMASGPSFDPSMFTRRITQKEVDEVFNSPDKPFLNRALQGYPPASTFKIVSTAAGLESGKYTPDSLIMTSEAVYVGGTAFHEHGGGGYGAIGFRDALTFSSNTFFYRVGMTIGPSLISQWGHKLGIGETKLNLDGETQGFIPTPETKSQFSQEPWYVGDTVTMAIGQGMVTVTPMEMAVMIAAIANGGKKVKPHLLFEQSQWPQMQPEDIGLKPSTLATIRAGLSAVVREGTARRLSDGSIPLTAGKTGTAEVPGGEDNSLYVGYGPLKDPQLAVAVVVERGGFGAEAAVPIAHKIYKAFFKPSKSTTMTTPAS